MDMKNIKTRNDIKRPLPVRREVDVLVCGGGPAGFSAAAAAARMGAETLLVEQCNCLGGISTAGGHNRICLYSEYGTDRRIVGGITWEIACRVAERGYGFLTNHALDFELEGMKLILEEIAKESEVNLLYHTFFADAIVEDGKITGAYIQSKSGRQAVLAKRVVDATGDADVAASAGAPWEMGRPEDGAVQPCTLMFNIGGVDWEKVKAWRSDYKMEHVWLEAQRNGDMEAFQTQIMGFWWTPTRPDQVGVNFTHIVGCDPTDSRSVTDATIEGRRQAFQMIPVFRKYVPGMENCYMVSTAALLGTRESRRIIGEVVLTENDIINRREWSDAVCYGSFFIDIHNCKGPGLDGETYYPEPGFKYQIPYRAMIPLKIRNLLVAGRCVSVTHKALGSTRVMPQCSALGEAAGTAAALSIADDVPPDEIDVQRLREHLRKSHNILDEQGILAANP